MTLHPHSHARTCTKGRHRATSVRRRSALTTTLVAGLAVLVAFALTGGNASAKERTHHAKLASHSSAATKNPATRSGAAATKSTSTAKSASTTKSTTTTSAASTTKQAATTAASKSTSSSASTQHSASAGASSASSNTSAASGRTMFGTTVQTSGQSFGTAFNHQNATFGGLKVYRVFYSGTPTPWPGRAGYGKRPVVVSFDVAPSTILSGRDDTAIRNWFRTAPRTFPIYYIYYHEPENNIEHGDFSPAAYKAAWQHVRNLQRQSGRMDLKATLNLMCWTAGHSGRDWHNYYPGGDVIDLVAFDCYNAGRKNSHPLYEPAANIFQKAQNLAHAMGKPWAVAELGSPRIPGDSSGNGRAAWLRSVASFLSSHGALFACYFDSRLGNSVDFRLTDGPSQSAWRSAVQS